MDIQFRPDPLREGERAHLHLTLPTNVRRGSFIIEFATTDGHTVPSVFEGVEETYATADLRPGEPAVIPVLFPTAGDFVLRYRRATNKRWEDEVAFTVIPHPEAAAARAAGWTKPFPLIARLDPDPVVQGETAVLTLSLLPTAVQYGTLTLEFDPPTNAFVGNVPPNEVRVSPRPGADTELLLAFPNKGDFTLTASGAYAEFADGPSFKVLASGSPVAEKTVALAATPRPVTADEILWQFIDAITAKLRFDEFREFVMVENAGKPRATARALLPENPLVPPHFDVWRGTVAYDTLRDYAEEFVNKAADPQQYVGSELTPQMVSGALTQSYVSSEGGDLAAPFLGPVDPDTLLGDFSFPLPNVPFVELIWNYWIEEGMLVQTLHHILAKFQNRRPGQGRDPLERFDLNPLLPLRQLLWGFAEDERRRLTVRRRAAEYEYEYGLQLRGRAIPPQSSVVERRSAFLEAFHSLLYETHRFYKERDDKTIDADAFPLLSGLRELHLVLAYGAHNQFANLALQARSEMILMQWLLAQPEMREFLGGRTMVPYEEPWMDRVDAMKSIQGWADTSVTHFFDLAFHGERILLSVRHGRWNESGRDRDDASSWALRARNSIQRYIHAYRAVTGVDLSSSVNGNRPPDLARMPSDLLLRRVGAQQRRRA